jgi:hypothetical protein
VSVTLQLPGDPWVYVVIGLGLAILVGVAILLKWLSGFRMFG